MLKARFCHSAIASATFVVASFAYIKLHVYIIGNFHKINAFSYFSQQRAAKGCALLVIISNFAASSLWRIIKLHLSSSKSNLCVYSWIMTSCAAKTKSCGRKAATMYVCFDCFRNYFDVRFDCRQRRQVIGIAFMQFGQKTATFCMRAKLAIQFAAWIVTSAAPWTWLQTVIRSD